MKKNIKNILIVIGALAVLIVLFYLSLWIFSKKSYNVEYGISFSQDHAWSLGLDWTSVYWNMITELQPKYIRISAMWSQIERVRHKQDFSEVDWMMDEAAKHNIKVILVVGQKAPRWPECHVPEWINEDGVDYKKDLAAYFEAVVERYKNHPALELWQVENEPYIRFVFGKCDHYDEKIVVDEIAFVKKVDPNHKIIITDSGELSTWRKAIKTGDYFGTTLYRMVRTPNGGLWSYDWLPAAAYRWKAKFWGLDLNKMFVSELQAEPWFTNSNPKDTPVEIQEQTMNPERLKKHMDYAEHIGVSRAYLWGVEWWYWIKEIKGDSRYWDIVKEKIKSGK